MTEMIERVARALYRYSNRGNHWVIATYGSLDAAEETLDEYGNTIHTLRGELDATIRELDAKSRLAADLQDSVNSLTSDLQGTMNTSGLAHMAAEQELESVNAEAVKVREELDAAQEEVSVIMFDGVTHDDTCAI